MSSTPELPKTPLAKSCAVLARHLQAGSPGIAIAGEQVVQAIGFTAEDIKAPFDNRTTCHIAASLVMLSHSPNRELHADLATTLEGLSRIAAKLGL